MAADDSDCMVVNSSYHLSWRSVKVVARPSSEAVYSAENPAFSQILSPKFSTLLSVFKEIRVDGRLQVGRQ